MRKLLLLALVAGALAYFGYQSYMRSHPGADSSAAGRGMSRMRGNSRELEEVGR